jgi:hypothetical protein
MLVALVANRENETNTRIVRAGGEGWLSLTPAEAVRWLRAGDVALGRRVPTSWASTCCRSPAAGLCWS